MGSLRWLHHLLLGIARLHWHLLILHSRLHHLLLGIHSWLLHHLLLGIALHGLLRDWLSWLGLLHVGILSWKRIAFLPVIRDLNLCFHFDNLIFSGLNNLLSDDLLTWLRKHLLFIAFLNEDFFLDDLFNFFTFVLPDKLEEDETKNTAEAASNDGTNSSSTSTASSAR